MTAKKSRPRLVDRKAASVSAAGIDSDSITTLTVNHLSTTLVTGYKQVVARLDVPLEPPAVELVSHRGTRTDDARRREDDVLLPLAAMLLLRGRHDV